VLPLACSPREARGTAHSNRGFPWRSVRRIGALDTATLVALKPADAAAGRNHGDFSIPMGNPFSITWCSLQAVQLSHSDVVRQDWEKPIPELITVTCT